MSTLRDHISPLTATGLLHSLEANFAGEALSETGAALLSVDAWDGHAAAILLLHFVCLDLSRMWESPMEADAAEQLRAKFLPSMILLAEAMESADPISVVAASNALAQHYR